MANNPPTQQAPDLTASDLTVSDATPDAGQAITVTYDINNIGDVTASNFESGIYLSTNSTITTSDTLLGGFTGHTLSGGAFLDDLTDTVTIPTGLAAGTYYIGVIADDTDVVSESDESNNTAALAITVQQPVQGPDLTASDLTVSDATPDAGQAITVTYDINNIGDVTASNFESGIYLSTNSTITTSDTLLGGFTGHTLSGGAFLDDLTDTVTIPTGLAAGTYYIGVIADDTDVVSESDETNNSTALAITVEPPAPRATVVSGVFPTGNAITDALIVDGDHWSGPGTGTTINVYLSDLYRAWNSIETAAITAALAAWEAVANIDFQFVTSANAANFVEYVVPSSVEPALGSHGVPNLLAGDQVNGYFNYEAIGWDETDPNGGLNVGGYGYLTLVHELGHGLGLDHPHGGTYVLPGVTSEADWGENNLNQGIFTVMSYNVDREQSAMRFG